MTPGSLRDRRQREREHARGARVLLLTAAFTTGLICLGQMTAALIPTDADAIAAQRAELAAAESSLDALTTQRNNARRRAEAGRELADRHNYGDVLTFLSVCAPGGLEVGRLTIDRSDDDRSLDVSISGRCTTHADIGSFVERLKASDAVDGVEVSRLSSEQQSGITFDLTLRIEAPGGGNAS